MSERGREGERGGGGGLFWFSRCLLTRGGLGSRTLHLSPVRKQGSERGGEGGGGGGEMWLCAVFSRAHGMK